MPSTLDLNSLSHNKSWYSKKPFIKDALFTDLQNGSYFASIFTLIQSLFLIGIAVFDIYLLSVATPGSTYYRHIGINFIFVYSGNQSVRFLLIAVSVLSFFFNMYLCVASIILMRALRKEHENKFHHWMYSMAASTAFGLVTMLFKSIANDLYYTYHQFVLAIYLIFLLINVFCLLVVYSNFQELKDITNLEDMARLKMGTMSTLNMTSRSLSLDTMRSSITTASV